MHLSPQRRQTLRDTYRRGLLESTLPFWLKHGIDRECGGLLSGLGEDGTVTVRRSIGLKVVTDERICDGYDYVSAFK